MRAYTTNILPTDSAYYTLANAVISNKQLRILPGGSATININKTQLATLTEFFRVTASMSVSSDPYEAKIQFILKIISVSGEYITHYCNMVTDSTGLFSTELEAIAEDYTQMQVIIKSSVDCTFASWGLEPELSTGDVQVEIDGVKQSLPRLLYDYNTTTITVGQLEQNITLIALYLSANTDLQGHFLMNCNASERCTVYLRFYDNTMQELFSPLLYTINAGLNTLTVPHAYLNKLAGIHNLMATAQTTNGQLTIPVRNILFTVDGGYLAKRLISPGMDIQDITIRQLDGESAPSEIWAVGIDNNIITVKKRIYDVTQASLAWEAISTLGQGKAAAIEFDGIFARRNQTTSLYTLFTGTLPFAAVITLDGTLQIYKDDYANTPYTVDTGVTQVSMVRGFKSARYPEQDQGMIIVYVKDGNVFYKQFAYYASTGTYQWLLTEQLTDTGNVQFAQVHRLNDYRIGVIIQTDTENLWYITARTYVGQSVETEVIAASVSADIFCLTPLSTEDLATYNTVATQTTYDNPEIAPTLFALTWEMADEISFFNDDTFNNWSESVKCVNNGVEIDPSNYTISLSGNTITVTLTTGIWGAFTISWDNINLRLNLSNNRFVWPEQRSYSWTIQHTIEENISELLSPALTGTIVVTPAEQITIQSDQLEPFSTFVSGTCVTTVTAITTLVQEQEEPFNTSLSGTFTATAVQTGSVPI